MKFKKIILTVFLLLAILTIGAVSAEDNLTDDGILQGTSSEEIQVSDDDMISSPQEDVIATPDDGTFTALQKKIRSAASGSTISLENDYVYDEGFNTNGIDISNKELTINGNGHSINGLSKSRIFHLDSDYGSVYKVTLNDIVLCNGYGDDGGAINARATAIYGKPLEVNDCKFIGNKADDSGGAVYTFQGMWLKFTGCVFENNSALSGGAILTSEGAVFSNCNFTKNSADSGGAIMLGSMSETTNVNDCAFTDNYASENGGAIYSLMSLDVESSTFTSNYAENGGAINVFLDNLNIKNSGFDANNAAKDGGAIYYDGSSTNHDYAANIEKTSFTNNIAAENGGAIYDTANKVKTSDCTFVNNKDATSISDSPSPSGSSSGISKTAKATPKLTAKKATFKVKTKIKKYTATLKTNKNKAMKKVKLYLKVNGKTYTAKTGNTGKATFKIKNLKKKGTFKATVTFKGNKNYKKVTKSVEIKCR